jgi:hypothetical protein
MTVETTSVAKEAVNVGAQISRIVAEAMNHAVAREREDAEVIRILSKRAEKQERQLDDLHELQDALPPGQGLAVIRRLPFLADAMFAMLFDKGSMGITEKQERYLDVAGWKKTPVGWIDPHTGARHVPDGAFSAQARRDLGK